jgi:hypothetical protein
MTDTPDAWSMMPEQAAAALAEMTAAFRATQPVSPQQQLDEKYADPKFRARLDAGSLEARAEFDHLVKAAADADPVQAAMTGSLPEIPDSSLRLMADFAGYLREVGLRDEVVQEALENRQTSQAIHDEAVAWRERHLKDEAFVKAYLGGDQEAVQKITLCSIVLAQPIAKGATT